MRPNTDFLYQQEKLQLEASRCRQQSWYRFMRHKLSSFCSGERGAPCLVHSQQACRIVSTLLPTCFLPTQQEPLWPFPDSPPATSMGPRHRQVCHHPGCTAARELATSRVKSQARAAVDTWQEGWTVAAEGTLTHPRPSPVGGGGATKLQPLPEAPTCHNGKLAPFSP